jgi:hypothetical protein
MATKYLHLLIVYPGERFRECGIQDLFQAIYGQTQNEWMDGSLFDEFISINLLLIRIYKKTVILFVDSHLTHM